MVNHMKRSLGKEMHISNTLISYSSTIQSGSQTQFILVSSSLEYLCKCKLYFKNICTFKINSICRIC